MILSITYIYSHGLALSSIQYTPCTNVDFIIIQRETTLISLMLKVQVKFRFTPLFSVNSLILNSRILLKWNVCSHLIFHLPLFKRSDCSYNLLYLYLTHCNQGLNHKHVLAGHVICLLTLTLSKTVLYKMFSTKVEEKFENTKRDDEKP